MESIESRLKSEKQVAIARLQDIAMESVLVIDKKIVMHGGTAIWRCYNGKRFSFDIDLYASDAEVKVILEKLSWELHKRGAEMDYPIGSERIITVHNPEALIKLEMLKKPTRIKSVQIEYTKTDGTKMFVNTLSASDFILEKIKAYESRMYMRDLYDIYILVANNEIDKKSKSELNAFLLKLKPPSDAGQLKDLVYEGIAPSFEQIYENIKKIL
ncbi:MAG: nucleotidyl transferase AbiEii/AbiGii toxin family protein [Candidatus Micrarchaeaceae archaeon]